MSARALLALPLLLGSLAACDGGVADTAGDIGDGSEGDKADDGRPALPWLSVAAFIQCPLAEGPFSWFEGDDRDFGRDRERSRMRIDVEIDPFAESGYRRATRVVGRSREFSGSQTYETGDSPCDRRLVDGAVPKGEDTASADEIGGRVRWMARSGPGTGILRVTFDASASNPLQALAPAADLYLEVDLDLRDGVVYDTRVVGEHDGYPAYEVLLDGEAIYTFDANEHGGSPLALFPPMEIQVFRSWAR